MNYLKSEHLKFKRTISNKLLFIIPFTTAILAWLIGGFTGYQYMTLYWWYSFLLPGAIAILCSLSHKKEENAGKYYSVFSMPVNLLKFETAKSIILIEKLLVAAVFLAMLISISNIISPATAWWFVPYCWAAKLAEPLMGIQLNGTYLGSCGFSVNIPVSILLSMILFVVLSFINARDFLKVVSSFL